MIFSQFVRRCSTTTNYNLLTTANIMHVKPSKILFENEVKSVSYGDFLVQTGRVAQLLSSKYGISKGDRVLSRTTKSIDNVALYMACLQLGAIYVPVNPAYTPRETAHYVQDSEPKLFVTCIEPVDRQFSDRIGSVVNEKLLIKQSLDVSPATDVETVQKSDIACICYTSGTTGLPKGAMLTHGSLSSNAQSLVELWKFTEKDRLLHMLPFYHVHGMFISLNCALFSNSTVIWREKFDADDCLRWLPKATVMMGVPTFYSRLLNEAKFSREVAQHMRLFVSGSAPLSLATWEEFEKRTGHRILERYGMTEAQVICSNLYEGEGRVAGSVGQPLKGTELRLNESGGIEIRSESLFGGYWRNPEKTQQDFTDDGFFITGDVAEIDSNGFVHIMGRSKDLIISGGFNVYPKEIEDFVDKIKGVKECAVIGIPHKDFGEAVVAVVAADGKDADRLRRKISDELKREMAYYKVPKQIIFVDALLRNSMAKVQKVELRKQYADLFN